MSAIPSSSWQASFLSVLPVVQTHARIQFRHLSAERREDAIQEAIAAACVTYQLLATQGRLDVATPGTLATYAVRYVCGGRHVGGSQDATKDVLSPVAQRRGGFRTGSDHRGDPETGEWQQIAIATRSHPIPDTAAFRIDFASWLRTLTCRDRRMIRAFIRGEGTGEVASRFGLTPGRISQLRRRYEHAWGVYQRHAAEVPPIRLDRSPPR